MPKKCMVSLGGFDELAEEFLGTQDDTINDERRGTDRYLAKEVIGNLREYMFGGRS